MTQAAKKRGVHLSSKSRPLKPEDLSKFEYIVGMDPKNLTAMTVRPARAYAFDALNTASPHMQSWRLRKLLPPISLQACHARARASDNVCWLL